MQKKQKIKPAYFYSKNHRTNFSIATPAARVSHSSPGSFPAANAEILTLIFWYGNYKGGISKGNSRKKAKIFIAFISFKNLKKNAKSGDS
jgi:hypothetical protein